MPKIKSVILLHLFSCTLNAANIIDVFGTDPKTSEDIIRRYGVEVGKIETEVNQETMKLAKGGTEDYLIKVMLPKRHQLSDKIKKKYHFYVVHFDTILYPNDKDVHTTIEVVERQDVHRRWFIPKTIAINEPSKKSTDLIDKMITFHDDCLRESFNNPVEKHTPCPAYHCLPGWDYPTLNDTFVFLTNQARKEKKFVLKTLAEDPVSERRVAASYLIGYFDDPHEIISLLTKYVMDPNDAVRNSAMRVIAETMRNSKISDIDVTPLLALLDSPLDTDRNKSLFVLLYAVNSASSKQTIMQAGKKQLIALLRLKQPNNHDLAYLILKKISGKDFGPYNIKAWETWLSDPSHQ